MTWSRIQSAKGTAFGTSVAATFSTANVSAGNKIIAVVSSSWRDPPSSVKDAALNSWTLLGSQLPASNGGSTWLYALDVPAGDAGTKPTITATFPSSNGQSIVIQEVSGLLAGNTSAMIDGTPAGLSGTGSATGSPTYSSTAANEYLVCCYGDANSAATLAPVSGMTLDPNNATTQSFASIEFGNSTAGSETTGFTGASTGQWSVLTVAFKLAANPPPTTAPPPAILAHPTFTRIVLEGAYERADWPAQGVADLTVSFASTSGGVDTWNVTSPWNGGGVTPPPTQQMRVLKPTSAANQNYPHAFLIMLPVDANQGTTFGDSIATAQAISANDAYNLTIVQPGYAIVGSTGPWQADNPLDPTISQEKYTLLVTAWIRQHLATTGTEQVYLIGFSRSGLSAQFLLFRHPYTYAAVASWDAPFGMTDYNGADPYQPVGGNPAAIFGTSVSFQTNYQLSADHLAAWQATGQYTANRIWIGVGPDFQDTPHYDASLTSAGIPHTYTFSNTSEAHAWQTDWVAAALAAIIPSYYSQAPTVLPQQYASNPVFTRILEAAAWRLENGITPAPVFGGTGAIPGTGTLAGAGVKAVSGTSGITAGGAASPAGLKAAAGTGSVTGTGRSTPAGSKAATGTSRAAGTGVAVPSGTKAASGTSGPAATGTLAGAGTKAAAGTSAQAGTGRLADAASKAAAGTSKVTGTGLLSDAAAKAVTGSSALAGTGYTVTSQAGGGTAAVAGTGGMLAAGFRSVTGSSAIAGTGRASGAAVKVASGHASLPGTGTPAGTAARASAGTGQIATTGRTAGAGTRASRGTSAMAATGLTGGIRAPQITGSSSITGTGTATAVQQPARTIRFSVLAARHLWSVSSARQSWSVPSARNDSSG